MLALAPVQAQVFGPEAASGVIRSVFTAAANSQAATRTWDNLPKNLRFDALACMPPVSSHSMPPSRSCPNSPRM